MFDPYLIWLDIPAHERPATHYRLLGLRPLENDPQVIAAAANRVIAHVSRFQQTEHATACQQLLAELNAARNCLLDPLRKSAYDSGFAQGNSPGERPITSTPQVPGGGGAERQIASSPPVPGMPASTPAPTPATPVTRPAPPAAPQQPVQEQPIPGGVPSSVQPTASQPIQQQPLQQPSLPQQPLPQQPAASAAGYDFGDSTPTPVVPTQPSTPQPPAWAGEQRTGEVETVIAGKGASPVDVAHSSSGRTNRSRKLRRAQQANSAYMLVGIAMAMVVFFFGAVLVLAIYLGG